jgi:hypothetical protein
MLTATKRSAAAPIQALIAVPTLGWSAWSDAPSDADRSTGR